MSCYAIFLLSFVISKHYRLQIAVQHICLWLVLNDLTTVSCVVAVHRVHTG